MKYIGSCTPTSAIERVIEDERAYRLHHGTYHRWRSGLLSGAMLLKVDAVDKKCPGCGSVKLLSTGYYNNKATRDKKTTRCKTCVNHRNNVLQKETKALWAANTHQRRRKERPSEHLWKMARHRAKEGNIEFSISPADILVPEFCPYLETKFSFENKATIPSLDRIDPTKGYIKGNIQVISWMANQMKNNASIEQLMVFAKGIMQVHSKAGTGCAA